MNTEEIKLCLKYAEHANIEIKQVKSNSELFSFCNDKCFGCAIISDCAKMSYKHPYQVLLNKEQVDFLKQQHPELIL